MVTDIFGECKKSGKRSKNKIGLWYVRELARKVMESSNTT